MIPYRWSRLAFLVSLSLGWLAFAEPPPGNYCRQGGPCTISVLMITAQETLKDSGDTKSVTVKAPATQSASWTWTYPTSAGTSGQVLTTNGSGVLSWASTGSVTGSGAATRVAVWSGTSALTGYSAFTSDASGNLTAASLTLPDLGVITSGNGHTLKLGVAPNEKTWIGFGTNAPSSSYPISLTEPTIVTGTNGNAAFVITNNADDDLSIFPGSNFIDLATTVAGRYLVLSSGAHVTTLALKAGHVLVGTTSDDSSGASFQVTGNMSFVSATPQIITSAANAPLLINPNGTGAVGIKSGNFLCLDGTACTVYSYISSPNVFFVNANDFVTSGNITPQGGTYNNAARVTFGGYMTVSPGVADADARPAWTLNNTLTIAGTTALMDETNNGTYEASLYGDGTPAYRFVDDTTGRTVCNGAATINAPAGQGCVLPTAASVTITDSAVTALSNVLVVMQANDASCFGVKSVIPAAGSFVVTLNAACTGAGYFGFQVIGK